MPVAPPPIAAAPTGGESIYRTIMNRLTALEANHTLYARYVEQQTSGVREMLKRLAEDVGRLEGIVSLFWYEVEKNVWILIVDRLWFPGAGKSTSANVPAHCTRLGKAATAAADGVRRINVSCRVPLG